MPQQFKITKDEAAIFADLLLEHKYDYSNKEYKRENAKRIVAALSDLQERVFQFSKDKRLHSRKRSWSLIDRVWKYVLQYESR